MLYVLPQETMLIMPHWGMSPQNRACDQPCTPMGKAALLQVKQEQEINCVLAVHEEKLPISLGGVHTFSVRHYWAL